MRIERHSPAGYAGEADWRRMPVAETAAAAVASVGRAEEAASRLRQNSGEALAQRRQERLRGALELAGQTADMLARTRQSLKEGEGSSENETLLEAVAALMSSPASSDETGFIQIFPPLPSPLANVRAALRAYVEQGATTPDQDLEDALEVRQMLKDASDLLAGNGSIYQTLVTLRARGASSPQIEATLKDLEVKVDRFREKLSSIEVFPKVPGQGLATGVKEPVDLKA